MEEMKIAKMVENSTTMKLGRDTRRTPRTLAPLGWGVGGGVVNYYWVICHSFWEVDIRGGSGHRRDVDRLSIMNE